MKSKLSTVYFGVYIVGERTPYFPCVGGGGDARDLASGVKVSEHVIRTYFINNPVQGKVSVTPAMYVTTTIVEQFVKESHNFSFTIHSLSRFYSLLHCTF